jgi:hypothetical protein
MGVGGRRPEIWSDVKGGGMRAVSSLELVRCVMGGDCDGSWWQPVGGGLGAPGSLWEE